MLLLVQLAPWQAEFWGKTTPAQGRNVGLSTQGQYLIGRTSLLWCAKAIKFSTVKQHKVQPRSDSLRGPVKYSTLTIGFFWSTAAGQVSLGARFIHSGQSQSDKEKSGFILVGRVKHWHYPHGLGECSSTISLGWCCVQYPHRDKKPSALSSRGSRSSNSTAEGVLCPQEAAGLSHCTFLHSSN